MDWLQEQEEEERIALLACKARCGCLVHAYCGCYPNLDPWTPCGHPCRCTEPDDPHLILGIDFQ